MIWRNKIQSDSTVEILKNLQTKKSEPAFEEIKEEDEDIEPLSPMQSVTPTDRPISEYIKSEMRVSITEPDLQKKEVTMNDIIKKNVDKNLLKNFDRNIISPGSPKKRNSKKSESSDDSGPKYHQFLKNHEVGKHAEIHRLRRMTNSPGRVKSESASGNIETAPMKHDQISREYQFKLSKNGKDVSVNNLELRKLLNLPYFHGNKETTFRRVKSREDLKKRNHKISEKSWDVKIERRAKQNISTKQPRSGEESVSTCQKSGKRVHINNHKISTPQFVPSYFKQQKVPKSNKTASFFDFQKITDKWKKVASDSETIVKIESYKQIS